MTSTCEICNDILLRFTDPTSTQQINLGSFEEALSSQCPDHVPLIQGFNDHCNRLTYKQNKVSKDVGFVTGDERRSVSLFESITTLGGTWSLILENKPGDLDHTGTGRVLDPEWVDLDIVKKWKRDCLSSHSLKCENPIKIRPISPALLVDTKDRCIVPGKGKGRYIALSYRWGDVQNFRLDTEALERLRRPDSLDAAEVLDHLPPLIQHAIKLTPLIGERYLWVDALCIVYGGHASTGEQLNLMSAIYASAVLTIIAADGDSKDGLLGLKGISTPRNLKQKIFPLRDEKLVVRNTGIFSMGSGTKYYDRAWTYQEYKMSPRKLLFNRKELHWECQCNVWHEELTLGTEVDKYIDPRLGVMLAGFPDVESLSHMIGSYNKRELTYAEDASSGITGLLTVLSRTFEGGFLYGCPEMFFDRALGWQPQWIITNLKQRMPSDRPPSDRVGSAVLPSWSWLGWDGLVSLRYGEAARINDRQNTIEETIPITEWYTSSAPKGRSRRRIRSTWFENRDTYKKWANDPNKPLPDGWTRHETTSDQGTFRDEPRIYPDGCGGQVFKHRDMPDPDCPEWFYPFPVPPISVDTAYTTPEQTQYLFCKTKRASLWSERANYEPFPGGHNHLKLRTERLTPVIGRLHLANDEQLSLWPQVASEDDENAQGRTVELVAIYESVQYSKTYKPELKRYDYPLKREQNYAVLWVEWQDGVAYRLACGHVDKDAWDGLQLEDIDLVLG